MFGHLDLSDVFMLLMQNYPRHSLQEKVLTSLAARGNLCLSIQVLPKEARRPGNANGSLNDAYKGYKYKHKDEGYPNQ